MTFKKGKAIEERRKIRAKDPNAVYYDWKKTKESFDDNALLAYRFLIVHNDKQVIERIYTSIAEYFKPVIEERTIVRNGDHYGYPFKFIELQSTQKSTDLSSELACRLKRNRRLWDREISPSGLEVYVSGILEDASK